MTKFKRTVSVALLLAFLGVAFMSPVLAEDTEIRLGVAGSVYEEVWAPAKEKLKAQGIELDIVVFSDYVTPNNALSSGDIDLNAFQHRIFLEKEIEDFAYPIEIVGNTFIIPLNLYSSKIKSLDEVKEGDIIAIPNDVTNGGRALKVLEAAGFITIGESAGFNPTLADIESYQVGIKIEELAANIIPTVLADLTAGIINGNFALDYGIQTEEAIFRDSSLDEKQYWNLIAARSEDVSSPEKAAIIKKVVAAFQSPETEAVFNQEFGGYFIKVGWDVDEMAE